MGHLFHHVQSFPYPIIMPPSQKEKAANWTHSCHIPFHNPFTWFRWQELIVSSYTHTFSDTDHQHTYTSEITRNDVSE